MKDISIPDVQESTNVDSWSSDNLVIPNTNTEELKYDENVGVATGNVFGRIKEFRRRVLNNKELAVKGYICTFICVFVCVHSQAHIFTPSLTHTHMHTYTHTQAVCYVTKIFFSINNFFNPFIKMRAFHAYSNNDFNL